MERHVRIAVAKQSLFVGDFHAAQDQFAVFCQAVGVKALTDAGREGEQGLGHAVILRCGQFEIQGIALHQVDREIQELKQCGVVRAILRCFPVRAQKQICMKTLRRLHGVQTAAIQRLLYDHVFRFLDGILYRYGGNGAAVCLCTADHAVNDVPGDQRPGAVVDEYGIAMLGKRCQRVFYRLLAGRAAVDDLVKGDIVRGEERGKQHFLIRAHGQDQMIAGIRKRLCAADDGGHAAKGQQRFAHLRTHPGAAAAAQNHSADAHCFFSPRLSNSPAYNCCAFSGQFSFMVLAISSLGRERVTCIISISCSMTRRCSSYSPRLVW